MGPMLVPADAYYGAQTARAVENFPISDLRFPRPFIRALGLIKKHAAVANAAGAKLVLDQYKTVLAEAGMTMDDLVSVQVFCSDVKLFDSWNKIYPTYFGKDLPARAFIGSGPLLFGARFEMQAVAVRR